MNAGPGLFRCPRCGETKPKTPAHFYFDRTGRVTGYCRDGCQRAYLRERVAGPEERDRRRAYLRAWYRAKRARTESGVAAHEPEAAAS